MRFILLVENAARLTGHSPAKRTYQNIARSDAAAIKDWVCRLTGAEVTTCSPNYYADAVDFLAVSQSRTSFYQRSSSQLGPIRRVLANEQVIMKDLAIKR